MMKEYDIVILGGGIAALSAAMEIRTLDTDCSLLMISDEDKPCYSRPMLTKTPLENYRVERGLICSNAWYEENRIDLLLSTQLLTLIPQEYRVETTAGSFGYKKCIYALGAHNFIPPFPGRELAGVADIRGYRDIYAIKKAASRAGGAVVIGGGIVGLEAACMLRDYGLEVCLVEAENRLMPRILDEASARLLEERLPFPVITGARVLRIGGDRRVRFVELEGREPIPAELVIISCGVRPNADIARAAGIATERGVMVDEYMQTSEKDIYACGNCVQLGGATAELWSESADGGRIAGHNAAGGHEAWTDSDSSLLFNSGDFGLFADGDLGKKPGLDYRVEEYTRQTDYGFQVNPKPGLMLCRDFYLGDTLTGAFRMGDLSDIPELLKCLGRGGAI